jgi:hypothetical protein
MSKNMAVKKIFRTKKKEMTGEWKILNNEELYVRHFQHI